MTDVLVTAVGVAIIVIGLAAAILAAKWMINQIYDSDGWPTDSGDWAVAFFVEFVAAALVWLLILAGHEVGSAIFGGNL